MAFIYWIFDGQWDMGETSEYETYSGNGEKD